MTEAPTSAPEVAALLDRAEQELLDLAIEGGRADWVYATYITPDSEALSARANARMIERTVHWVKATSPIRPDGLEGSVRRRLKLLRLALPLLAPSDPKESAELTSIVAAMSGAYARGRYTPQGETEPLDLQALERILLTDRNPARLADVWSGWHSVGRSMATGFTRYVELGNRGAREVGFDDLGAMWRSKYDMAPDAFATEVDRLWEQVRPFYASLHAYVRSRLRAHYGASLVPADGPIPAHLLGNMWAQEWQGIFPLVAPPTAGAGYDLTQLLVARSTTPEEMVRYAERFFVSLGLDPLPSSFWERSMLVRPRDREVICHASAWDLDYVDDLRIKMCIEITSEDFATIHHELGHNYYQRAYGHLPFLFRDSAHDGFHEAIGDTIGLSVTPEYLVRIGLLGASPPSDADLGLLLYRALEKVAFLPFGLAVDRWRWDVFAGRIAPRDYTRSWWELRRRYQGIAPPTARAETEFDPGAKFHVPANVPYMRYFLAHILQFQFHRALTRAAGASGPLHRASIYGSHAAGDRLRATLALGQSREWPDALEALTGERQMDASAMLDYFAPLRKWLDEQNRGVPVGW